MTSLQRVAVRGWSRRQLLQGFGAGFSSCGSQPHSVASIGRRRIVIVAPRHTPVDVGGTEPARYL